MADFIIYRFETHRPNNLALDLGTFPSLDCPCVRYNSRFTRPTTQMNTSQWYILIIMMLVAFTSLKCDKVKPNHIPFGKDPRQVRITEPLKDGSPTMRFTGLAL